LAAIVAGFDAGEQPRPGLLSEVVGATAQHPSNPIQWIAATPATPP